MRELTTTAHRLRGSVPTSVLSRSRHLRHAVLAIALVGALAGPAHALPGDETLLLDICINDRCIGVAPVIARGDDVLVDSRALITAGLDTTGVTPERIGERSFISLHQLNHGSTFAIDRTLLRLDLTLRADRLPRQRVSMVTKQQAEAGLQPWSAFLNYGATAGSSNEQMLYLDGAIGRGNAALRSGAQWDEFFGWRRGLTRFEYDQPHGLRRWTVGDQYAIPRDPLGGSRLMGGFGVERAFDIDPDLITFPQPYYSGVLESPGTVEVYANGALIGRRDVAAGPFTLEQLGVQPGRNDVRVIVRDPFGNRSELASQTYYAGSPRLLAPGLSEYAVRIGAPRTGGGLGGHYEDSAAWQAWYRRGLTNDFTLGGRVEGDEFVRNAGVDAAWNSGFGEFAFAYATSDTDFFGRANAYGANYSLGLQMFTLGLGTRRAEIGYRNLNDPFATLFGTLRIEDYASISISPPGPFNIQFNAGRQQRESGLESRSYGATGSLSLWSRGQLFMTAQRIETNLFRDTSVQLSLNIALNRQSINISARRDESQGVTRNGYQIDARRALPQSTGWGYVANLRREDDIDYGFGQVEYQGTHGRIAGEVETSRGDTNGRVFASGAIVGIGGRMFFTPPVDNGFALVRVPGLANVPILRENQEVGRTDSHGDLLVRDLLPFQVNRIALDEAKVPASWSMQVPLRDVSVSRNTGSMVTLESSEVHAVTGHFRYTGGAAGDILHLGDAEPSTVGTAGLFYLDNVVAGRHTVAIDTTNGPVACTIDVPAGTTAGIIDLGNIACGETR
jgi:outer membrane usher protein